MESAKTEEEQDPAQETGPLIAAAVPAGSAENSLRPKEAILSFFDEVACRHSVTNFERIVRSCSLPHGAQVGTTICSAFKVCEKENICTWLERTVTSREMFRQAHAHFRTSHPPLTRALFQVIEQYVDTGKIAARRTLSLIPSGSLDDFWLELDSFDYTKEGKNGRGLPAMTIRLRVRQRAVYHEGPNVMR